jgi:Flp pilus assembly protein TadG
VVKSVAAHPSAGNRAVPGPSRPGSGDLGAASTELVIAAPLLALLLLLIVQFGVWAHAQHVAHAAANEALQAARAYQSSAAIGNAQGQEMLDQTAGAILNDHSVSVTRGATTVSVTIAGHAASVVPGLRPSVRVTVVGPVERADD